MSLLEAAVYKGHEETAKVLVSSGANVNFGEDNPPLHVAVQAGNVSLTLLILGHGADINRYNIHGKTALHEAVSHNNLELVRLLLSHSAKIDIRDDQGRTPLRLLMDNLTPKQVNIEEQSMQLPELELGTVLSIKAIFRLLVLMGAKLGEKCKSGLSAMDLLPLVEDGIKESLEQELSEAEERYVEYV